MYMIYIPKYNLVSSYNAINMHIFRDDHLVEHTLNCGTISSFPKSNFESSPMILGFKEQKMIK